MGYGWWPEAQPVDKPPRADSGPWAPVWAAVFEAAAALRAKRAAEGRDPETGAQDFTENAQLSG